jgi:hypothetical protein
MVGASKRSHKFKSDTDAGAKSMGTLSRRVGINSKVSVDEEARNC